MAIHNGSAEGQISFRRFYGGGKGGPQRVELRLEGSPHFFRLYPSPARPSWQQCPEECWATVQVEYSYNDSLLPDAAGGRQCRVERLWHEGQLLFEYSPLI